MLFQTAKANTFTANSTPDSNQGTTYLFLLIIDSALHYLDHPVQLCNFTAVSFEVLMALATLVLKVLNLKHRNKMGNEKHISASYQRKVSSNPPLTGTENLSTERSWPTKQGSASNQGNTSHTDIPRSSEIPETNHIATAVIRSGTEIWGSSHKQLSKIFARNAYSASEPKSGFFRSYNVLLRLEHLAQVY